MYSKTVAACNKAAALSGCGRPRRPVCWPHDTSQQWVSRHSPRASWCNSQAQWWASRSGQQQHSWKHRLGIRAKWIITWNWCLKGSYNKPSAAESTLMLTLWHLFHSAESNTNGPNSVKNPMGKQIFMGKRKDWSIQNLKNLKETVHLRKIRIFLLVLNRILA